MSSLTGASLLSPTFFPPKLEKKKDGPGARVGERKNKEKGVSKGQGGSDGGNWIPLLCMIFFSVRYRRVRLDKGWVNTTARKRNKIVKKQVRTENACFPER